MIQEKLIGAIILNPELIEEVFDLLPSEEYFSNSTMRMIYKEMLKMNLEGYKFDLFTLADRLGDINDLKAHLYLINLTNDIGIVGDISVYCYSLIDEWKKVQLQGTYYEAIKRCNEQFFDADELKLLTNKANDILEIGINSDKSFSKVLMDVANDLDKLMNRPEGLTGLDCGIGELNRNTNGLQNTDLMILAGRPAQGKTALSLNLAYNVMKQGKNVLFVSLEMGKEQLTQRMISIASGIDFGLIRNGRMNKDEFNLFNQTINELSKMRLTIDDRGGLTIQDIFNKARKLNRKTKIDFIIIDYLQLCYSKDRKNKNREQEIAEISRKCKELAKELNVPVLALSQMSRSIEQSNRKPRLSDLRESGAIEQDADMVIFIHHENNMNQLVIAKNRNGQVEDLNVKFIPSKQLWTDFDGNFTNGFMTKKIVFDEDIPF